MLKKFYNNKDIEQGVIVGDVEFNLGDYSKIIPAVCLTPACDLALQKNNKRKADYVLFCGLVSDAEFFTEMKRRKLEEKGVGLFAELTKDDRDNFLRQIDEIINDNNARYFWIYNHKKGSGLIADFQIVTIEAFSKANLHRKKYILQSSYRERIASKYGSYMGRIGTEDIDNAIMHEQSKRIKDLIKGVNN